MAVPQYTGSQQGVRHAGNTQEGGDSDGDRRTVGSGVGRTAR